MDEVTVGCDGGRTSPSPVEPSASTGAISGIRQGISAAPPFGSQLGVVALPTPRAAWIVPAHVVLRRAPAGVAARAGQARVAAHEPQPQAAAAQNGQKEGHHGGGRAPHGGLVVGGQHLPARAGGGGPR